MTGPEHYAEAENLLAQAAAIPSNSNETNPAAALLLKQAQVHVGLATTAAIALGGYQPNGDPRSRRDMAAWREVAGSPAPAGQEGSR
jgi:hypothetical protein